MEKLSLTVKRGLLTGLRQGEMPFDLSALEAAVNIGRSIESTITALTMGPPRGENR